MDLRQTIKEIRYRFNSTFPEIVLDILIRNTNEIVIVLTVKSSTIKAELKNSNYFTTRYPLPDESVGELFFKKAIEASLSDISKRSPTLDRLCSKLRMKLW